jgi:hypothetical protein
MAVDRVSLFNKQSPLQHSLSSTKIKFINYSLNNQKPNNMKKLTAIETQTVNGGGLRVN